MGKRYLLEDLSRLSSVKRAVLLTGYRIILDQKPSELFDRISGALSTDILGGERDIVVCRSIASCSYLWILMLLAESNPANHWIAWQKCFFWASVSASIAGLRRDIHRYMNSNNSSMCFRTFYALLCFKMQSARMPIRDTVTKLSFPPLAKCRQIFTPRFADAGQTVMIPSPKQCIAYRPTPDSNTLHFVQAIMPPISEKHETHVPYDVSWHPWRRLVHSISSSCLIYPRRGSLCHFDGLSQTRH
jgi:hypothetical protein